MTTDTAMQGRNDQVADDEDTDARETPSRHNAHPGRRLPDLAHGHPSHGRQPALPGRNISVEV